MSARATTLLLLVLWTSTAAAQNLDNLQIHGFATQGFLYSSRNNYLTMNSSSGSLRWTEGAVSVSDAVTDNLRIGIQFHMYEMGDFGGPNVIIDWASGDYKVNDRLGFSVGKIKTPIGLFNDSQDVDPLFLWVLLPQGLYPIDNRDFDLSELGGQVYGGLDLGKKRGRVEYRAHVGGSKLDANGGYVRQLEQFGMSFPTPPSGKTYGGDLRWVTPWQGLTIGASILTISLDGTGPQGTVHIPTAAPVAYYAQWSKGRLHLAGEYWRTPLRVTLATGAGSFVNPVDQRGWYPMVSVNATKKLQLGTYYSHYLNHAGDTSLPQNYSKDWVVSSRYDFNPYCYGKIEGHFLHGDALGYYSSVNPNGLSTNSNMLAARIGFSF